MSTPESKPPVTEAATAEDQSSTESATESVTEQQIDSEKETSNPESHENGQDDGPEPPFSVFTIPQKRLIVILASLASLFSPLTGSIYWPATTQIAADLNTSVALINLTITTYIIFQGLAPTFVGTISDVKGRRPLYIICFIIFLAANIALALQDNYVALLVVRCLQSSGSSGTIALANAVVADVVTSAERGQYIGYASVGALLGPAFGPVLGGLLSQYLGWRAVFWFLAIFSAVVFIVILVAMPETCRAVVGNGSIPPPTWNMSLLAYLVLRKQRKNGQLVATIEATNRKKKPRVSLLGSIRIVADKESGILLLMGGIIFAGFYMVMAALPTQLEAKFGFDPLRVGLCYIPLGMGSLTSAIITGRIVDMNFGRHAKKLGMEISKQKQQNLDNFPIERARLEVALPLIYVGCLLLIAYGWIMELKTSLAGLITLMFFIGYTLSGSVNLMNTLVVDLNRESPATATAAMNLVRCLLGAGAVALVVPLLNSIGMGWTSTLVAFVWVLVTGLVWIVVKFGPRWRKEKREMIRQMEAKAEAKVKAADPEHAAAGK